MDIVTSIEKARERGFTDDEILKKIEKENLEKKDSFTKAKERGRNSTEIIEEIIKQNSSKKENKQNPYLEKSTAKEKSVFKKEEESPAKILEKDFFSHKDYEGASEEEKLGRTVLKKEIQEKEEKLRNRFLQRIEAKLKSEKNKEE